VVNRRNAMWTAIVAVVAVVALVFILFVLYRSGQLDRYVASQIISTLAKYNVKAEVGSFTTRLGPREVEIKDLKLYNSVTGAPIGNVGRIVAKVRVEDMWALNLTRNVNLETLTVDRPEIWVSYDAEGRSNFSGLKIPPPEPNQRILFAYSTAHVTVNDAIVHYDDRRYDISGEARNVRATVQPDDPNAPAESRMNVVEFASTGSTFTMNGRAVNPIDIKLSARTNQVRADIQELVLKSPVAEAHLTGALEDWRALRYHMDVRADVDLTQTSDVLRLETTMRGAGRFEGKVEGEGDKYKVEGSVVSDALAADGVRLKALQVNASASGQGSAYEARGKAVAELLTAGDFQLNLVQLVGGVTGTGSDFRWLGDLRAASARSGSTSVMGLFVKDARAELKDGEVAGGSATSASADSVVFAGGRVAGGQVSGVKAARDEAGRLHVTADSARAGTIVSKGATVGGVQAAGVDATINPDNSVTATVARLNVAGLNAAGARTGSLNVAGVRLSVSPAGRVEGTSNDIGVGTVAFTVPASKGAAPQQGRVDNVRLARPRFTLEPGGRYRASADLSLGGGVLGQLNMGKARAAVVATNDQIQLNDFVADLFNGSARGSATIATSGRAASSVRATFENVDAGGLLALTSGNAVPLTGAATGTVNLTFPGTNFKLATGRVDATFEGATGRDESARTPLTGQLALTADRGLFNIERANLRAGATELTATGRFSFQGGSDLAVNLNSTDAAELQTIALSTGLLSEYEDKIKIVGVAGNLRFNGNVTGDLDAPIVNGRFELQSLTVRGRDLGALSADIASSATETRIDNGRLSEPDGGGVAFKALIPRAGENNIEFDATLENVNAGNLVAALATDEKGGPSALANNLSGMGPASGKVSVKGYPGAMQGNADLRVASGRIGTTPYDEAVARATFSGSSVNLDTFNVKLGDGSITATGGIDLALGLGGGHALPVATVKDFRVEGKNVDLNLFTSLFGGGSLPALSGKADFNALLTGNLAEPTSIRADINAQGRDVTINGQPAGQLTLVGKMTGDQKFVAELTTGLFGKPQVVRATLDLAGDNMPVTAETTLTGADLTPLFAALLNNPNVQVTGRATGTIRATGTLLPEDENTPIADTFTGRAEFSELAVQVQDVELRAESPLVVTFKPNEVAFERTRFTGPGTNITFGGTAALAAGGRMNLSVNGDLNLRFLSSASRNTFLSGVARVAVAVGGSYEKPQVTGTASVENASLALLLQNERLTATQINASVRFNSNQANLESLTGRLGGGRVSATGGALISGFQPTQFRLVARGENVTVPAAAFVTLPAFLGDLPTTADANLEIRGGTEGIIAQGTVKVRRTEITEDIDLADLIDRRNEVPITSGGGGGAGAGAGIFGPTTVDLTIQGQDALVVRNNLADMVGSLNLRVQGPIDAPVSSGRITATRGTVAFRNDRYEILRAIIDLPPRVEAPPVINLQAQADIRGYRVTVTMSGPISGGLTTTATSDPPLPQADVIALITTGNLSGGPEGTSTLAQTGLGTATSLLTDTLINAPVQKATDKLFGLNRFEFDPVIAGRGGQSPTARLTVGRQVNRNLAITYSTNVTGEPNQVIAVEYRVSDRLSFIAQYQQGSTDTLRTRSNNFNFELRFRKRY
jgi:hypothetical protein